MAPRAIALSLLLALAAPILAPAAAAVCEPAPDCAAALAGEAAAPLLRRVSDVEAVLAPWVGRAEGYAHQLVGPAIPPGSDSIVLAGPGVATVRLASGTQGTCEGEPRMVLEASRKSFGLEPSVTMSYGGGRGQGGLLAACAMGQQRQPVEGDITGDFEGAWSATKRWPSYSWTLTVSAPLGDGTRDVGYVLQHNDGTRQTFAGKLSEYR